MLARLVRQGLVNVPDEAEVVVWRDGMRVKTSRTTSTSSALRLGYTYDEELDEPEFVEAPAPPVEPRWHVVRATPTRISGVNYLTSYAAVGGLSNVAHLPQPLGFQIAWRVDRETGKCDETWIHTVSQCGQHWTSDLAPNDYYSAANMVHETMPEGFRLCKLCAKWAGIKLCQHCGKELTGTQKKWCSAHSSAHMRRDS